MRFRLGCFAAIASVWLTGCAEKPAEDQSPSVQIEIGKDGKLVDVKSPIGDVQVGDGDKVVGVQSPLGDVEVGRDAEGNTSVDVDASPEK